MTVSETIRPELKIPNAGEFIADLIKRLRASAEESVQEHEDDCSTRGDMTSVSLDKTKMVEWEAAEVLAAIFEPENQPSQYGTALTAALSDQVVAPNGWQDISTAPKDEMFIWAYRHDGKWRLGLAYQNVSGSWSDAYGSDAPRRATHWASLPAPPPSSTAGEGK